MAAQETTAVNGSDDLKIFTFRNVPADVKQRWKVAAAIEGVTMEEIGVKWLKEGLQNYFLKQAEAARNIVEQQQKLQLQQEIDSKLALAQEQEPELLRSTPESAIISTDNCELEVKTEG